MFKQKSDPANAKLEPADAVQQARTRARQRLIGAVVLLAIGIIGFPLVFETQPRPIPVDIPIEIPRKDTAPPLVAPPAPPSRAPVPAEAPASFAASAPGSAGPDVAPTSASRASGAVVTETSAAAGRDVAAPRTTAPASATSARPAGDGQRALALLEGRPAAGGEEPRFVVQVGAFADAEAAREIRKQAEKLGLKTYTQIAQTPAGSRVRVRVGPFATRDGAEAALAKAKAAGLAAVLLTL
jgi:DedD protein